MALLRTLLSLLLLGAACYNGYRAVEESEPVYMAVALLLVYLASTIESRNNGKL